MTARGKRCGPRALAPVALALVLAAPACGRDAERTGERLREARSRAAPAEREWRTYLADRGASHHSPLDRIRRANVARLEVAWIYEAGDAAQDGTSQIQCNPIVVKGVLYGTSPSLRLFALDAATGEEIWSFQPAGGRSRLLPNPNRGVAWWAGEAEGEEGDDERILYTVGHHLYAVDARTGRAIRSFGNDGRVDLRDGLGERASSGASVVATTPGTLFDDLLILGSRVSELHDAAPGDVRAYDVRSGAIRWVFHTIPRPGEPGHETWPPGAWKDFGGANAWAGISVDAERGLAFIPTGSVAFDFFGGDRAGDNLFANSLVAVDARTGERRWHFQTVRHDLWDRDLPAPPNLLVLERGGARIPAVAQVTKTGHVFVFQRETGEPLFPIEEVPVAGPGLPGEALPASQPVPIRPPPFVRQRFGEATVTSRTPEAREAVRRRLARLRTGPLYTAPSLEGTVEFPGMDGGAEWGGAAWDAETGLLYVNANDVPWLLQVTPVPVDLDPARSPRAGYLVVCGGCHGADRRGDGAAMPSLVDLASRLGPLDAWRVVRHGRGRMPPFPSLRWYEIGGLLWYVYTAGDREAGGEAEAAGGGGETRYLNVGWQKLLDPDGFPAAEPPWGTLSALDLNAGTLAWQIPLGDYPQTLAEGKSGLGAESYGGPLVTAGGLLFIAATPDEKLRAFDKRTGELLWESPLPAAGFATPATYEAAGRQFVVIAAGGGKLGRPSGSRYVAFALPAEDAPGVVQGGPR